jgi:mannose-6-phosphate isomerase-like protein (cupin superfamily)
MADVQTGDGWAAANLDDLGEGPGFRKVRKALGVESFGANAVILPAGYATKPHYHDRQEELYLVLEGEIEFTMGGELEEGGEATVGGESTTLGPGGVVRVSPHTVRMLRNTSPDATATYFAVGAADGYAGRDGRRPT